MAFNGSIAPDSTSATWRRWLRSKWAKASSRPVVRFKLSREGFHFVLILLFILIGAVLRDISLLVLLAGVMFSLLLVQWRLGMRTMTGLDLKREAPQTAVCEIPIEISLKVYNHRRWLAAWLLTVENPIEQLAPIRRSQSGKVLTVIDDVAPNCFRKGTVQVLFHQRGHYRLGNISLWTRYPLNLGKTSRQFPASHSIIVHPKLGTLTNRCQELFRVERQGLTRAIARAGINEGEFFGLRQWHNGDSQRWIHWRTTARLGELSVRQFEQQQRMQSVLLLDLFERQEDDWSVHESPAIEKAVSFMATMAVELVGRGRHKLSVGIAGREVVDLPNVQSPILVNDLLNQLACAASTRDEVLPQALEQLQASLVRNPMLIVISTRSNVLPQIMRSMPDCLTKRILERLSVRWINVAADDLEPYFRWSNKESSASAD